MDTKLIISLFVLFVVVDSGAGAQSMKMDLAVLEMAVMREEQGRQGGYYDAKCDSKDTAFDKAACPFYKGIENLYCYSCYSHPKTDPNKTECPTNVRSTLTLPWPCIGGDRTEKFVEGLYWTGFRAGNPVCWTQKYTVKTTNPEKTHEIILRSCSVDSGADRCKRSERAIREKIEVATKAEFGNTSKVTETRTCYCNSDLCIDTDTLNKKSLGTGLSGLYGYIWTLGFELAAILSAFDTRLV